MNIDTVEYVVHGHNLTIPGATTANVITPDGEIIKNYQNRVAVPGKHGLHRLHVRTQNFGKSLEVEGSPYAFLFGQNVFTSADLQTACVATIDSILAALKITPDEASRKKWEAGEIDLNRTDLAFNFDMKTESAVKRTLQQIARQLLARGAPVEQYGDSVSWKPRKGKVFSMHFYAKGPEMRRKHKLKGSVHGQKLVDECKTLLRVELRLRRSALLKLGLNKVSAWTDQVAQKVFAQYMKKLRFLSVTRGAISAEELERLPTRLRPVLAAHKAGQDLSQLFKPRTLQRHRADFRRLGIDLDTPNSIEEDVVSLPRVLSPKRVINDPPSWLEQAGWCPPISKQKRVAANADKMTLAEPVMAKPTRPNKRR